MRETTIPGGIDGPVPSDPGRRASGVQTRAVRRFQSVTPPALVRAELPLVSIGSEADAALLEPTYAYLSAYCFACLPPVVAQRLNVAIYELYANALRYGCARGEVRLEIQRSAKGASLHVSNYADAVQLERLRAQMARVQQDAALAFSAEMGRFAGAAQPAPMLGLVRIAHEVGLRLEFRNHRDFVEISTVCEA